MKPFQVAPQKEASIIAPLLPSNECPLSSYPAHIPTMTPRRLVPAPHGQQQWAPAILIVGVHIHTPLQQHGDRCSMAPPSSHMQWGLTTVVLQVQVPALG